MNRLILTLLTTALLYGCASPEQTLVGKPVYSEHFKGEVTGEHIIVYGKLKKNVLREPTGVFHSAFGHAYCMNEEISFEVLKYLRGSGPDLIQFREDKIDSCKPLAEEIGFGEAILSLSKNEHRGVWNSGSMIIGNFDGEKRIYKAEDLYSLIILGNIDELLTDYEAPFEWFAYSHQISKKMLERLEDKGILSYKLHPEDKNNLTYSLEMYKYVKVDELLKSDFLQD